MDKQIINDTSNRRPSGNVYNLSEESHKYQTAVDYEIIVIKEQEGSRNPYMSLDTSPQRQSYFESAKNLACNSNLNENIED
jgi:hypothetical protein